jgi:hypothetical protein
VLGMPTPSTRGGLGLAAGLVTLLSTDIMRPATSNRVEQTSADTQKSALARVQLTQNNHHTLKHRV